ncbi:MAG: potassium channel family protein [Deltaproteobacteria bacterium]|nr:potassium channel family protein [Deltaproteobacteria bacterium]
MARPKPAPAALLRVWKAEGGLAVLLAFILVNVFVLGPLRDVGVLGHLSLAIVFALILISGVVATASSRGLVIFFTIVVVITQVVHWVNWYDPSSSLLMRLSDITASLIAVALLAGLITVQVFREGPVTYNRIFGAITVYLLIGMMFEFAYTGVNLLLPNAFGNSAPMPGDTTAPASFLYFSLSTLTTVGYGDIIAVHPIARSLANLESLIGQMFPAVLLARLVSMELYYRQRSFEREQAELDRRAIAREIARLLKDEGREKERR